MYSAHTIDPESDTVLTDTKPIQYSAHAHLLWKRESWWWQTSVVWRLCSGQSLCWSDRESYRPGLIWVQINTAGTWCTQVTPAVLKKQLSEVNPLVNHSRLTALCVPGCHRLQGRGVQHFWFQEHCTRNDDMRINSRISCRILPIIRKKETVILSHRL